MPRLPGGEAAIRARMAAAPGVSSEGGHRLAGLLEAECHLAIGPNNRTGWRCSCAVALRDDDRSILQAARDSLGLGHLNERGARNGSRPQVAWIVDSKVECEALADLLELHPFRGRKLQEYEIWREAVKAWAARRYGLAPGAGTRLARLARAIKRARAYRAPAQDAVQPSLSDPCAPHYFAGFFSGEGSFGLGHRNARFVIKLRRDDRPLLDAFCKAFQMGSVCDVATPKPWSPAAVWHVTAAEDVLRGLALLEAGGLLGRKRRQFLAWRPGAEAVSQAKINRTSADADVVAAARQALTDATAYMPPSEPLPRDRRHAETRVAYIDILRAWATYFEGRLSCTEYQAARELRPHWPKRETIAFAFGGWYEALEAAGLEDRAVRRPSARQLNVQLDRVHGRQGQ